MLSATSTLPERPYSPQAFDENAGLPVILQRAMVFKKIVEESALFLDDEELFAGSPSAQPARRPCPEMGANWIAGSLDSFSSRGEDVVVIEGEQGDPEGHLRWKKNPLARLRRSFDRTSWPGAPSAALITVGATGTSQGNISISYEACLEGRSRNNPTRSTKINFFPANSRTRKNSPSGAPKKPFEIM